jgi:hypothetical protein
LTSDTIVVGKWLGCVVPSSSRVAYDYFSYVPPAFRDVAPTWGGTREWLTRVDPDVIVVNRVTAEPAAEQAVHAEYYRCLADGSCGYGQILARGTFTVYAKERDAPALRTRAAAPGACE